MAAGWRNDREQSGHEAFSGMLRTQRTMNSGIIAENRFCANGNRGKLPLKQAADSAGMVVWQSYGKDDFHLRRTDRG